MRTGSAHSLCKERGGKPVRFIGKGFGEEGETPQIKGARSVQVHGFTLHAATDVREFDRRSLEKLIRYTARSSLALERLERKENGDITYQLLWLTDGSCIRLRPTHRNHVWSYDFVSEQTHDGRKFRILSIIDEYTRECLASYVARRIRSQDVILVLAELFIEHVIPQHIRSDNGPEFIAKRLLEWFAKLKVKPLFIAKGSPWENGYCESFNGKMRYQLLDGEIFYTLPEARVVIEKWRRHYNEERPHSSLKGLPPRAPETREVHIRLVNA